MQLIRSWCSLVFVLMACDGSDGGGSTTVTGACRLVGDAVVVPIGSRFDVAATTSGYEIVGRDDEGAASFTVDATTGALGPRRAVGIMGDGTKRVAAQGETRYATNVSNAVFAGLPIAKSTGGDWTVERSVEATQERTFTYGSDIVVAPDGEVVVVWLGATGLVTSLLFATYDDAGFGAYGEVAVDGVIAELGVEVAATFDAAGVLHVVVSGSDAQGESGLYAVSRDAAGAWSTPRRLGGLEGSLQGATIIGAAASSAGAFGFSVEAASFFDETDGGVVGYGLGASATTARGPADDRPVSDSVDAAPLGDGRVLVSASWGENNFDFAQSDDEVVLYACTTTRCTQALVVDGTRGTFFGGGRIATRGQEGVVVYGAEPKGDDEAAEQILMRRFTCDVP